MWRFCAYAALLSIRGLVCTRVYLWGHGNAFRLFSDGATRHLRFDSWCLVQIHICEKEDAFDWRFSVKKLFLLSVCFSYDSVLSCMNNLENKNKSQRCRLLSNPQSPVVSKKKKDMTKKHDFCPCWTEWKGNTIYVRDEPWTEVKAKRLNVWDRYHF